MHDLNADPSPDRPAPPPRLTKGTESQERVRPVSCDPRRLSGGLLSWKREPRDSRDQVGEIGLQLRGRATPRERDFVPDTNLGEHPSKLGSRQTTILLRRSGKGFLDAKTRLFQGVDVHQIAQLRTREQGAKLVREYLDGRIHADTPHQRLLRHDLEDIFANEIHNHGFRSAPEQVTAEVGGCPDRLDRSGELTGGVGQCPGSLFEQILAHEEIEIVGLPMTQVKACEGGAASQKEPPLPPEEA